MKRFHETNTKYLCKTGGWHAFLKHKSGLDPEIVLVPEAEFVNKSGKVKHFRRISEGLSLTKGEGRARFEEVIAHI